jgi:hypothetical protein
VLRVPSSFPLTATRGVRLSCKQAAASLLAGTRGWEIRSAGKGSKGNRWYSWAWIATTSPRHYLLIRRHRITGELAFHYCYVPEDQVLSLSRLIHAAGPRWPVEVGHCWHRSRKFAFSWLCSLFLAGLLFRLCPAGAGVEARWAGSALV